MNDLRSDLLRLIDLNRQEKRVPSDQALAQLVGHGEALIPGLVDALKDDDAEVRLLACELLGERRNKSGVLRAMTLLSDPAFAVRFAAGVAIGKTFNHWFHAVAVCVAQLKDPDERTRSVGKEGLLSLGPHAKADLDLLTMALHDVSTE